MFVIVDKDNLITELSTDAVKLPNGIHVKDKNYITLFESEIYEVTEVPEGIEPHTHCYTPEKGFYPYVPYEVPKEPMEKLREDLDKVTQEKNMLGMELASMKLADFEKTKVLNNLGAEITNIKLSLIMNGSKGGE